MLKYFDENRKDLYHQQTLWHVKIFEGLPRSLTYIENNKDPSVNLCGSPQVIFAKFVSFRLCHLQSISLFLIFIYQNKEMKKAGDNQKS